MINTAVAEELRQFADELEGVEDLKDALIKLIRREIKAHKRIIFNGNGYDDAWVVEAEQRGLHNLKSTAEALPHYTDEANVELFVRHNVYTREEMESREEALLEEYYKTLRIEALTMSDMVREEIVPACVNYEGDLSRVVRNKKEAGITDGMETELLGRISELTKELYHRCDDLERAVAAAPRAESEQLANYYHDVVLPAMEAVRVPADKLEMLVGKKYWPFPTYSDILFYV